MVKRGKKGREMHLSLSVCMHIYSLFACVCVCVCVCVYVRVSVKSKAGDLQVRFSIFTSPALSDFRWEKILCLPVSVGKEKIAFRYCLWWGRSQWSAWQDDFAVKFAIMNKKSGHSWGTYYSWTV